MKLRKSRIDVPWLIFKRHSHNQQNWARDHFLFASFLGVFTNPTRRRIYLFSGNLAAVCMNQVGYSQNCAAFSGRYIQPSEP